MTHGLFGQELLSTWFEYCYKKFKLYTKHTSEVKKYSQYCHFLNTCPFIIFSQSFEQQIE